MGTLVETWRSVLAGYPAAVQHEGLAGTARRVYRFQGP